MSPLIETLRVENGRIFNLQYHNNRMNFSRSTLFRVRNSLDIQDYVDRPFCRSRGLLKCRITYTSEIRRIEYFPYSSGKIEILKLVYDDTVEYSHKYEDRSALLRLFEMRGACDDILIVKNGFITDASFANVALYDGNVWCTPARPLLRGTMREYLLDQGILTERNISPESLKSYEKISLINAMLDMGNVVIDIENIRK